MSNQSAILFGFKGLVGRLNGRKRKVKTPDIVNAFLGMGYEIHAIICRDFGLGDIGTLSGRSIDCWS